MKESTIRQESLAPFHPGRTLLRVGGFFYGTDDATAVRRAVALVVYSGGGGLLVGPRRAGGQADPPVDARDKER